jgi:hypothetical protein
MLIEFKIQLDDNTGVVTLQPDANGNQNVAAVKHLPQVFSGAANEKEKGAEKEKGGDGPLKDPGTGPPHSQGYSSGSGMVFVLGPIVICGSGPGHTGPGGDGPLKPPGTGAPENVTPPAPVAEAVKEAPGRGRAKKPRAY